MVSRSYGSENFAVLVSTFYSDSWYVFEKFGMSEWSDKESKIVKYDLTVKPSEVPFLEIVPGNARGAAEIQAAEESNYILWFDRIGFGLIFILSNGSILVSEMNRKEIKLFRPTEVIQKSKKKKNTINWVSVLFFPSVFSVSANGRLFYIHDRNNFHITELGWPLSVKCITFHKAKDDWMTKKLTVPVTNGVFFCGEIRSPSMNLFMRDSTFFVGIPGLWNFGVTQRLTSFPELTGTCECMSVSEDLVACIMESQVCFFNVLKKAIVARTPTLNTF